MASVRGMNFASGGVVGVDNIDSSTARTLDLALIAGIAAGDKVRIQDLANRTQELFDRTIDLTAGQQSSRPATVRDCAEVRFVPQHADLRARFKFAEVLGSYATLNTLLDEYLPAFELTLKLAQTTRVGDLSRHEVAQLEDYRLQVQLALEHASAHLAERNIAEFTAGELRELNDILTEARARYHALEAVLGMRLIHDVELAVYRLHALGEKIATVQRSVSGVFLVDSEILFVPSAELVDVVDDIFKAIGNPFVVEHIDGTLLLAARNLLIQVTSFYAYYGREQIYRLFGSDHGKNERTKVAGYIKNEIKILFSVCKANNKLVLTRVMDNTEREFEISIEAIQIEAANRAISEVDKLIPIKAKPYKRPPPNLLSRLAGWLFRQPQ